MLLFKPFQKQDEFIEACLSGKYKYLLYGGAAGGGKSYVGLALLIFLCRVYPNSKWCVVRRDMTKIDQATVPTFNKLVPRSFLNKFVDNTAYFNNGSQIIFRGENYHYDKDLTWMDGFEVNGFLFEETQELQKKLFEKAKIRAGRHIIPNMPPILVIMTCNPSQNWSKDMFVKPWKEGKLEPPFFFLPSLTSDNSYLPEEYLENLKTLDTLTYQRYVLGDWDAIDVDKPFVYAFDPKKHIKKHPAPLKSLPVHLSFDFNIDPITCIAEQHNDKFIRIFKEFRLRNSNIYELCAKIREELGGYYFYVTGDAAGNARSAMDRDNLTYYKIIQKELGLKNEQMKVPSHNPLISNNRVLVNSIIEHHPDISIDVDCKFLIDDLLYVEVNHQGDIDKTKDKHRSHLLDCFVGETKVKTLRGDIEIKDITKYDYALTRNGYKRVIDKWSSEAIVYEFEFTDGSKIQCTKDHKFYTLSTGWLEIFRIFDENKSVWRLSTTEDVMLCEKNIISQQETESLNTGDFINKCGLITSEKYQKDITYITKMEIDLIMIYLTWNVSRLLNTAKNICKKGFQRIKNGLLNLLKLVGRKPKNGTEVIKDYNGIKNTQNVLISGSLNTELENAMFVQRNIKQKHINQDSALTTVSHNGEETQELMILNCNALNVEQTSKETSTLSINQNAQIALEEVKIKSVVKIGKRTVYDITVDGEHEFFANGYLVHNCLRYDLQTFHFKWLKHRL